MIYDELTSISWIFLQITTETITTNSLWSCLRWNSLKLFDKITSIDVIPLTNHIQLVRDKRKKDVNKIRYGFQTHFVNRYLIDKIVRYIICSEGDAIVSRIYDSSAINKNTETGVNRTVWLNHIMKRTFNVLETHDIRILFDEFMNKGIFRKKKNNKICI